MCSLTKMHITCQSDIYFICKVVHNMDFLHFLLSVCFAGSHLTPQSCQKAATSQAKANSWPYKKQEVCPN